MPADREVAAASPEEAGEPVAVGERRMRRELALGDGVAEEEEKPLRFLHRLDRPPFGERDPGERKGRLIGKHEFYFRALRRRRRDLEGSLRVPVLGPELEGLRVGAVDEEVGARYPPMNPFECVADPRRRRREPEAECNPGRRPGPDRIELAAVEDRDSGIREPAGRETFIVRHYPECVVKEAGGGRYALFHRPKYSDYAFG